MKSKNSAQLTGAQKKSIDGLLLLKKANVLSPPPPPPPPPNQRIRGAPRSLGGAPKKL